MKKILFILIPLLALFEWAEAQRYPFRTYSIEQGLSESVVNDIVQDDDGYIWLATGYGLNRFDGIQFQNYFEEQGLNSSRIQSLYKDNDGIIWIGSDTGVNYWETDSIYSVPELSTLQNYTVLSIYQDQLENYWFATDGNGVWQYSTDKILTQYSTSNGLVDNRVWAIEESKNGDIWFGTQGGITILNDGNFINYTVQNGLPDNKISDITVDQSGIIWIGSRKGIIKYEDQNFHLLNKDDGLIHNTVRTLTSTDNGSLWIGTEEGASFYDGEQFKNYRVESGLSNQIIYSTYLDLEGNIWLGTFGGGVNLFLGDYFDNYSTDQGLSNNLVTSFTEDEDGQIWISTYGGGITSLNEDVFEDKGINRQLPDNRVYTLYTDSNQRMWIGMVDGLAYYENSRIHVFKDSEFPYQRIRDIMETTDSTYWISTYDEGIIRMKNGVSEQFTTENGLASNRVLKSIEGNDGSIWIATYGGITRYKMGEFQSFAIQEGLPNNGVMNLLKDDEGRIWASTFGGIAWFDGLKFQSITTDDGLPDRVCYFIEQSKDGMYWVGTTNGVIRFNADAYFNADSDNRSDVFQVLNKEQGLISDELNLGAVYEDSNGFLWFGTVEGLSRFNSSSYKGNPVPPKVHITGISASGREYQPNKKFTLSNEENYIEIQFSGISFTAPNQILYEYKLSGIDPDWQQTTARSVKYPSLPPNEYTFKVHARNINGAWSPDLVELSFVISAPFWMQWWFWILMLLIILSVIFLIYNNYRVRRMVDIERMRVRIASDLHDDVGGSLTEIALQSDFLQAGEADTEFKKSLEQIGRQCRKIVSSLDDIVWSIDARNDTMGDLTDRMQDYILNTLESKNMKVTYNFDDLNMDNKLPVSIKENLYLIFKEAVNNIAKHSDGDQVDIKLQNQNGKFEFIIVDNGTIHNGNKKTGHGLRNMDMRAQRIGANVDIIRDKGFKIIVQGKLNTN